ncbi:MAG: hypothetical protein R2854_10000 [Caldilineaceae bacterium]
MKSGFGREMIMTAFDEKGAPAGHAEQAQARPSGFFANRWVRIGLALLGVLVLLGLALRWLRPPELHGIALQSPDRAADFTLTASTGEPMSLSDFRASMCCCTSATPSAPMSVPRP